MSDEVKDQRGRKKIFILGISGFLGYQLALHLRHKYSVYGAYFNNAVQIPDVHALPLDIKGKDIIERIVGTVQPDFCITATGVNDMRACEDNPKAADSINVVIPLNMALAAQKNKAKHILLSCATVFDGEHGNYAEDGRGFTMNTLGKLKLTAETIVKAQTTENTTIRVGKVIGSGNFFRPSYFDHIRMNVFHKKPIFADQNITHSYISAHAFAQAIEKMFAFSFPKEHRTFHLGSVSASEAEMTKILVASLRGDEKTVKSPTDPSKKCNFSLNPSLFEKTFGWKRETKEEYLKNIFHGLRPGLEKMESTQAKVEA